MLSSQKLRMLTHLSFFECFSIPDSETIEQTEEQRIQSAEQRQETGCAICARKD